MVQKQKLAEDYVGKKILLNTNAELEIILTQNTADFFYVLNGGPIQVVK